MQYSLIELIEIITKLIGDWEMQFFKEYEKEGFTVRQLEYIDMIGKLNHPTLGEIAKAMNLSKPSITAIVDKLAVKGFVEKVHSDEDRRSSHVHLSNKGKKLAALHDETHKKIADLFIKNMTGKDLKTLVSLLNKVVSQV